MDEYPNPDEEYELLHQEEMEAMKELEVETLLDFYNLNSKKSKSSLNFENTTTCKITEEVMCFENNKKTSEKTSKRQKRCLSVESLTDITSDLEVIVHPSKRHKTYIPQNPPSHFEFGVTSTRVPKWSFIPVSTEFGDRLYVKVNDGTMEEDVTIYFSYKINNQSSGLLVTPYEKLKELALKIFTKDSEDKSEHIQKSANGDANLWVEKYKPKTYFDLLSDEAVNRTFLNWLKMWDKIVFNKEYKSKLLKTTDTHKSVPHQELDSDGRPYYKIALLCGPPGLGKTTLAHIAAVLAGYEPIEVNASDDRTVETFNSKLEAGTQMNSVLGSGKPTCLILDEIDGAPAPSIDYLLKFINGKCKEKANKSKKEKSKGVVKRPVICICNELYAPSLRQLRQQAFVVHFPHTSSIKLAQRLLDICKKQNIKTDISTLSLLCDKAQNDIRSCISTIHFFKNKNNQRFKSEDVLNCDVGQKDVQKSVFNMWKEIFHIPIKKNNFFLNAMNKSKEEEVSSDVSYSKKAMDKLQHIVQMFQSYGDYDRILQGVYENFLKSNFSGGNDTLVAGLQWFTWFDVIDSSIKKNQNFALLPYLPFSFAAWHFLFSSNSFWKISYPTAGYENHQKEIKCSQILNDVLRGLTATLRPFNQKDSILLDVLPMFNVILVPPLRPVNPTLFNESEKKDFKQLVDIMIDYNLNFIQHRAADGTYSFELDPNIDELSKYNVSKQSNMKTFSYNMKQLISHEVELERLRRTGETNSEELTQTCDKNNSVAEPKKVPQKEGPKKLLIKDNEGLYKDFFGRIVKKTENTAEKVLAEKKNPVKSPIWFSFKEGYNNAVKKDVTMTDIW